MTMRWDATLLGGLNASDAIGAKSHAWKTPDYFINSDNLSPERKRTHSEEHNNLEMNDSVKKKKLSDDIISDTSASQKIHSKTMSYQHRYSTSNTQKNVQRVLL